MNLAPPPYPHCIHKFFPYEGGGGLHFDLAVMSSTTALWSKVHEYANGRRITLQYRQGHPMIVGAEFIKNLYEHEGYLAFYTPAAESDQRTQDHVTGYRLAERSFYWLMETEADQRYDEAHYWQY